MNDASWPRVAGAATAGAALYAAAVALGSLSRPMFEDQAVLAYMGYLVTEGWVPYRDFYDMNTAGAHLANAAIGWLTRFSEGGARAFDLGWLAGLLWVTYAVLRESGRTVTRGALALVAAVYLSGGISWALEREALLLPFVAAALLAERRAAGGHGPGPRAGPAAAAGLLVGIAATIKPQAAIFVVPLAAHAWWRTRGVIAPAALAAAALVAPAALLVWLARHDALAAFRDIVEGYWPLYNAISADRPHLALQPGALAWARVRGAITFGLHPALPLAGAAVLGARLARQAAGGPAPSFVWLLAGMTVAAWIAVIPGAKFWAYHWWPFCYFAILLGAHAFAAGARAACRRPAACTIVLLFAGISWSSVGPWAPPVRFPFADVERMTVFLRERAQPGDTVVPLDWIEGALHAMLRARLLPGTQFVYDFHFSHHVSSPYIQRLRARFLSALDRNRPRFVIRIHRPGRFTGNDTAPDFPDLDSRLAARYHVAFADRAFEILERTDATPSLPSQVRQR